MTLEGRRARKREGRRPRGVAFEIPWRSFRPRTRFEKDGPEAGVLEPELRPLRAVRDEEKEGRRAGP